ncbi:MAG: hypothetical protein QOE33_3257 [Acidobacteriota bacterium]|nr:hypothetical protein [Acidobacteriota bacterium]
MSEQIKIAAQVVLAVIVIIAVFTVMAATLYFHSQKRTFPKQTIVLLQWLIKVLVYLFAATSFSVSGARLISAILK